MLAATFRFRFAYTLYIIGTIIFLLKQILTRSD